MNNIVSTENSTNRPLNIGENFIGPWQAILKYNSVTMTGKSNQECDIYLDFSQDGNTVLYTSQINNPGELEYHKIEPVRATLFRIRIINVLVSQSYLIFQTILSENNKIPYLKTTNDILDVNIASADNFEVSDSITHEKLDTIDETVKIINSMTDTQDGYSSIILEQGAAVYADSVPVPIKDVNQREGWYYTNTNPGNKMNYYFLNGLQETFTLNDITYLYAKVVIDNFSGSVQNLPFLTAYTKPTGSGDAGGFYHSKITYALTNNTQKIGIGEEVYFFGKSVPAETDRWFKNRIITHDDVITVGEALPTEQILFLSIGTDSAATALSVRLLVQELGFSSAVVKRKLKLIGYNSNDEIPSKIDETNSKLDTINTTITDKHLDEATDSVSVNLITNYATETGGNLESIKNKTETLTFHNHDSVDRLYTYDDIINSKLDTINTTITDKHLNEATDSVSVNLISNYATENGGNLELINNGVGSLYGEMMTANTKLDNFVFDGQRTKAPGDNLQNVLMMGFHEGHPGVGDDLHAISVNENGHISCNITSIEATENLNVSDTTTQGKLDTLITKGNKVYSSPAELFNPLNNNPAGYTQSTPNAEGTAVSLDGYDSFLVLCKMTTVTNPGRFQILVSYDGTNYWGLHTQAYSTGTNDIVQAPYYKTNSWFDTQSYGIVIGSGFGKYSGLNNQPFINYGYKWIKVRLNVSDPNDGSSNQILNPYFEVVRMSTI